MEPLIWILLSIFASIGSGGLVYFVMQSRNEVMLAEQKAELAAARAAIETHREVLEESIRAAKDSERQRAMEEFLGEIRIEERHYTREYKVLFMTRKSLVRQERIFFRNIPLSNWIEQESPIEEGTDLDAMLKTMSIFAGEMVGVASRGVEGKPTGVSGEAHSGCCDSPASFGTSARGGKSVSRH